MISTHANLQADKFTKEEEALLQELKLNCTDDGREIDHDTSALIFHKLGTLHFQRSEICSTIDQMICLIRCDVLLNAALMRTCSNVIVIKQDLKKLHQQLLQLTPAKNKEVDLCTITAKVRHLVEKMRIEVNRELKKMPKVEEHESENEMCKQELNKVNTIESLQNKITVDYTKIMASLAEDCTKIMGKAPCKFVIIGMGSLARKEITPFSDFEHVIVLDSKFDGQNEEVLNYFRWYSVIFQIILIDLGETIIPSVLNETNSKFGSWFYDDVTKSGVSFDGTFPWACKYPLGRQQFTKNKMWKTELIKSVPDMLKYLSSTESLKNGYHLGDMLTKICYVYGEQSVYEEFKSGVTNIIKTQNQNLKDEILIQIKNDLENFAMRSVLLKISDENKFNVKKDIYRVTTLFIAALGRLNNIEANSCFDIIRKLAKKGVVSKNSKHNLMYAIAIACEIRLRWYTVNKKQKDEIDGKNASKTFLEITGETSTFSYFQIAYALQCDISKRFDLKKGHFYSHPELLNISICSSFQTMYKLENHIKYVEVNPKEQRLLDFDRCLKMLKKKQTTTPNQQLPSTTRPRTTSTEIENDLCNKFFLLGQNLKTNHKYLDAKESFENALKIQKQISNDLATDNNVALALYDIGRCLMEMNKLSDAKYHLEQALQIEQRTSNDLATDNNVATTLHTMGQCLMKMNKLSDAKDHLEQALQIEQRTSNDLATDTNVATTLHAMGQCLMKMNKLSDAKDHLEQALQIKQQTSNDLATDTHVASTLHVMGQCLMKMNKLSDAKDHLEQALQIKQQTSDDLATDTHVAITLHVMGQCLMEMNKLSDAKYHLEQALQIEQRTSNDLATDINVATTLHDIGQCLMEMNKLSDAKDHLEQALQIEQRTSNNLATDINVAITLHAMGQCLMKMNKLSDAKYHLEQALEIKQRTSNDLATDNNVATTLHDIGRCLMKMNKLTDAKDHLEQALQIEQRASNDLATDNNVATTLHAMGQCLMKMNKLSDAKDHLEQVLQIKQRTSNDLATDTHVASTMHVMGQCLMKMNKLSNAKYHLEQALQIKQRTSNDLATDTNVASTLHVMGQCLMEMNKLSDAKDHLEQALQIKQRTSNDLATDNNVAITLHDIGQCLMKMNKLSDAKYHLEQALQIEQRTSNDLVTDNNVATTLHDVGQCLIL